MVTPKKGLTNVWGVRRLGVCDDFGETMCLGDEIWGYFRGITVIGVIIWGYYWGIIGGICRRGCKDRKLDTVALVAEYGTYS